jgi:hypothetical protein
VTVPAGPVLVVYASKHSSTAEIAERIAAAMRSAGCDAHARPAAEEHPTADASRGREARGPARRARARDVRRAGAPDPGNFVERAMLKNTPPERRDARDWPAIEEWARGVASQVAAGELAAVR